ncbi:MAG: hypothetical protein PHC62_00650 [Candidatus Izemoplasmatales bacterium]|nr:hypothetical protein [Candidatus Izemoplasmatales bacterium]
MAYIDSLTEKIDDISEEDIMIIEDSEDTKKVQIKNLAKAIQKDTEEKIDVVKTATLAECEEKIVLVEEQNNKTLNAYYALARNYEYLNSAFEETKEKVIAATEIVQQQSAEYIQTVIDDLEDIRVNATQSIETKGETTLGLIEDQETLSIQKVISDTTTYITEQKNAAKTELEEIVQEIEDIGDTFFKVSGGTVAGETTFDNNVFMNGSTYADDLTVGNLLIQGQARFTNGLIGEVIPMTIVRESAPTDPPTCIGNMYIDTTNQKVYLAMGTSAVGDWKQISLLP